MSAGKHTPGPWRVAHAADLKLDWSCYATDEAGISGWQPVIDARKREVAFVVHAGKGWSLRSSMDADARLIAAAPELLEALHALVTHAERANEIMLQEAGIGVCDLSAIERARAAISKAQGAAS